MKITLCVTGKFTFTDWPGVVRTDQGKPVVLSWQVHENTDFYNNLFLFAYLNYTADFYEAYQTNVAWELGYEARTNVTYDNNNRRLGFTLYNVHVSDAWFNYRCLIFDSVVDQAENDNATVFVYGEVK